MGEEKESGFLRGQGAAPDVAEALLATAKKQVFYARLAAIFTGALFCAIAIALAIVVPQVSQTLGLVNGALSNANGALVNANSTLADIDAMSASIVETSDSLNELIGENAETLTQSVQRLSEIDFEGINTAVQDLQDAVGPLAEAMNRMSSFSLFGR